MKLKDFSWNYIFEYIIIVVLIVLYNHITTISIINYATEIIIVL